MSYLSLPSGAVARPVISGITDAAGLRSVAPSSLFGQGSTAKVEGLGTFAFNATSFAIDDGTTVIKPNDLTVDNPGRWLIVAGGAVTGTGTAPALAMWSAPTALTDSPLSFASQTLTFAPSVRYFSFGHHQIWTIPGDALGLAINTNQFVLNTTTGYLALGQTGPTALLDLAAGNTARSPLRMRAGVAPTSPNTGDVWFDGTNLNVRNGGGTQTIAYTGGVVTSVSASAPLSSSGGTTPTISLGTVGTDRGGTGLTATPTNGQLPIGNGAGYLLATLTPSTGIAISNGAGSITISATGPTGSGTTNTIPRWTSSTVLDNSGLIDNGTSIYTLSRIVGVGTATPTGGRSITTTSDMDVFSVRVGRGAGSVVTNTAVGAGALNANTTANENTAVGYLALATTLVGSKNTAVGSQALTSTIGDANVAVGNLALYDCSSGQQNTAVGMWAAYTVTSGQQNTAVGAYALNGVTSGNFNTAIGASSGLGTGSHNTALGRAALGALTSGQYNVGIGSNSAGSLSTGSENIIIGYAAAVSANSVSNETVIGSQATGNGSNTVTIGNSSNVGTFLDTKYLRIVDSYTVGALPGAGTVGRIARVTDGATDLPWGSTITGGGTDNYLVWDNGTNWTVFGA